MSETRKVKGPVSYFPSIEKTYGDPISHWMGILKQAGELSGSMPFRVERNDLISPWPARTDERADA